MAVQGAWDEDVRDPAVALVRRFFSGEDVDSGGIPPGRGDGGARAWSSLFTVHTCNACGGRTFRGEGEWTAHTASRKHKKRVAAARRGPKRPRDTDVAAASP